MKGDHSDLQQSLGDFRDQLRARSDTRFGSRRRSGGPGVVFAILLILAGILVFLDNIGWFDLRNIWRYWPVALIAIGTRQLFSCRGATGRVWSAVLITAGGLFLLRNLGVLKMSGGLPWALLLIGLGVLMLAGALERRKHFEGAEVSGSNALKEWAAEVSGSNALKEWAVFGGSKRRLTTQEFQGGELLAVFGGIEIDLRKAGISSKDGEVVIDANATFGGIEIKVPETWSVNVRGVGIFGAYEDKTIPVKTEDAIEAPKLAITGYAIFGGVTVQN